MSNLAHLPESIAMVNEFLDELDADDDNPWGRTVLDIVIRHRQGAAVRLIQYRDGEQGAVLWEDGWIAATWTSYDGKMLRCASRPDDSDGAA